MGDVFVIYWLFCIIVMIGFCAEHSAAKTIILMLVSWAVVPFLIGMYLQDHDA